jgi:ubiquinone/menaquinone biosynthesis C-methylase UbiE
MKISRKFAIIIHFVIDNLLPPFFRDSKFIMGPVFYLFFGKKAKIFMECKDKAPMDDKEFVESYRQVQDVLVDRETDLNEKCFSEILRNIKGKTVLEVGFGRGLLSNAISSKGYTVTAADILVPKELKRKYPKINFVDANIEKLPFKNKSFDTVVCTHTLEHVQDIYKSVSELKRVTKKRLIIVVPKERPYKYTFNLHLHFFPYASNLLVILGRGKNTCRELEGDWYYQEEF